VSLAAGAGLTSFAHTSHGMVSEADLAFALRGGVVLGRVELALEVVPDSLFVTLEGEQGVSVVATAGYLARLAPGLYWPVRGGIGVTFAGRAVFDGGLLTAPQIRLDVVGLVFQYGHVLFEFDLPSVRYHPVWPDDRVWPDASGRASRCAAGVGCVPELPEASAAVWCGGGAAFEGNLDAMLDHTCGSLAQPDAGVWMWIFAFSVSYLI
jgi:hypothetical protein